MVSCVLQLLQNILFCYRTAGLKHLALNASKFTSSSSDSLSMRSFLSTSVKSSTITSPITSCPTTSTAANSSSTCLPIKQTEVFHSTDMDKQKDSPLHTSEGYDKEQLEKDITMHKISTVASPTSTSRAKRRRSTSNRSTSSIQSYFTPLANKSCIDIHPTSTEPAEETQQHKRCKVEEEEVVNDENMSEDKQTSPTDGATSCPVCGAMVSGCMAEHLDYHTAMDLHKSFQNDSSFDNKRSETHRRHLPSQEKIQMFFKRT